MQCPAANSYQNTPTVVTERTVQGVSVSLFLLFLYFIAFATSWGFIELPEQYMEQLSLKEWIEKLRISEI